LLVESVLAPCPPQPVRDVRGNSRAEVRSAVPAPASCPHFAAGTPASDDYCDYIRPAWLSAAVPLAGRTADDAFLLAGLASAALWWRLRQRDLDVVATCKMHARGQAKILNRIAVIDDVLGQHAQLVIGAALDPRRITLRLSDDVKPDDLVSELFPTGVSAAGDLGQYQVTGGRPSAGASAIAELANYVRTVIPAAAHPVPFRKFLDMPALLAAGDTTLSKYHQPSAATDVNDPLTFITSHQSPEMWFLAARSSISELRGELRTGASLPRAAVLARRIGEIMYLFASMIHVPQTIGSGDYMLFRNELCRGSGAESVQFRASELELGVRDPRHIKRLAEYGLLTDELNGILAEPSINEELMSLLVRERVISPGQAVDVWAAELAHAMSGRQAAAFTRGLAELVDAILYIEKSWTSWRVNHIGMVQEMIGSQTPGLAIVGRPTSEIRDGLPFLLDTLQWTRMFPVVWKAQEFS
jgi:tryptophan 2,3-dioxygenase